MPSTRTALWNRWKAFARRAAQVQSHAVLWLLYYVLLVPIAFVRRGGRRSRDLQAPAWGARITRTADVASARRQF